MILTVGAVAAGGACVARTPEGQVVFVRHALPGETVRVEVTSTGAKFLRADAVEVLEASPDRVEPPCPYARPGRCGGCDWQHAAPAAQRELKRAVVAEQLRRLARHDWDGTVEEVAPLLGWRTRVQWSVAPDGRLGLHRHRSAALELVDRCLIGAPGCDVPPEGEWAPATEVEAFSAAGQRVLSTSGRPAAPPEGGLVVDGRPAQVPHGVRVQVAGRAFEVAGGGFWQVHERAPEVLWAAVRDGLAPRPGESVVDLYAGVGLFAALLGDAVGPTGAVLAVEGSARACADAARNTADQPWVRVRTAPVETGLVRGLRAPDLVVLDPPRAGAGLEVTAALAAMRPRALAYVACDPASFARDLRVLLDAGWAVASLRALDLYPQTEHVELVTVLTPPPTAPSARPH